MDFHYKCTLLSDNLSIRKCFNIFHRDNILIQSNFPGLPQESSNTHLIPSILHKDMELNILHNTQRAEEDHHFDIQSVNAVIYFMVSTVEKS